MTSFDVAIIALTIVTIFLALKKLNGDVTIDINFGFWFFFFFIRRKEGKFAVNES